jgi:hypothetical protein
VAVADSSLVPLFTLRNEENEKPWDERVSIDSEAARCVDQSAVSEAPGDVDTSVSLSSSVRKEVAPSGGDPSQN